MSSSVPLNLRKYITTHHKPKVLLLCGPTGTYKTQISVLCAQILANTGQKSEIINADSVQIYSHLNIGSNRPSKSEMNNITHHLFGYVDPTTDSSVADYVARALETISSLHSKDTIPIITGGSSFYLSHLLHGVPTSPPTSSEIRLKIDKIIQQDNSWDVSLQRLLVVDPKSARNLVENDTYRLSRALEVFELTGKPLSSFSRFPENDPAVKQFDFRGFTLYPNHTIPDKIGHFRNLDYRCECMIQNGLLSEVFNLLKHEQLIPSSSPGKAIGYKQSIEFLNNFDRNASENVQIDQFRQYVIQFQNATRGYVRKQISSFRNEPILNAGWIPITFKEKMDVQSCAQSIVEQFHYNPTQWWSQAPEHPGPKRIDNLSKDPLSKALKHYQSQFKLFNSKSKILQFLHNNEKLF